MWALKSDEHFILARTENYILTVSVPPPRNQHINLMTYRWSLKIKKYIERTVIPHQYLLEHCQCWSDQIQITLSLKSFPFLSVTDSEVFCKPLFRHQHPEQLLFFLAAILQT